MSNCAICKTTERIVFYRIDPLLGLQAYCTFCSGRTPSTSPDVSYPYGSGTHTEDNIRYPNGHPKGGQCIPFSDKRSKKEAMRIAGVREAGDRIHGSLGQTPQTKKHFFT